MRATPSKSSVPYTTGYLLYLKQGEDCEYPPWTVVGLNEGLVYLHNARHSLEEQGQRICEYNRSSLIQPWRNRPRRLVKLSFIQLPIS